MPMGYGLRTRLASFWRSRMPRAAALRRPSSSTSPIWRPWAAHPRAMMRRLMDAISPCFLPSRRRPPRTWRFLVPDRWVRRARLGEQGLKTQDLLAAAGRGVDAFSYHFYGAVSKRCGSMPGTPQITPDAALSEDWLSRTDRDQAFYAALRDRFEPGKPLWLTETAETACGGEPVGGKFYRQLPLPGSAWKAGQTRRTRGGAQYAGGERLWLDRRDHVFAAAQLLVGAFVARR